MSNIYSENVSNRPRSERQKGGKGLDAFRVSFFLFSPPKVLHSEEEVFEKLFKSSNTPHTHIHTHLPHPHVPSLLGKRSLECLCNSDFFFCMLKIVSQASFASIRLPFFSLSSHLPRSSTTNYSFSLAQSTPKEEREKGTQKHTENFYPIVSPFIHFPLRSLLSSGKERHEQVGGKRRENGDCLIRNKIA